MNDVFTKIYKNKLKEIHDFLNSDSNILYISGFSGSGKSYVLKEALKTYNREILNFHYLCFKKTTGDDVLLSFYDTFRTYALKQVITLKKNPEEEFVQKVNFYFKNLEYPSVVIIDNYEAISKSSEVTDLLAHISSFENVKVIIISKEKNCPLLDNPTVSIDRIDFEKIEYEEFRNVLKNAYKDTKEEVLEDLYDYTDGYELYLKMVLTYIKTVNISINDLINEYKDKENLTFNDFIIEKQVSLIPTTYYPLLKNLSFIHHNVSPRFLEMYSLGDTKQLPYLFSKFLISEFWGTYYIKSYLRKYFLKNTSMQDKNLISRKLISIYKSELDKSPKDRLLRMSRETIRGLISNLEENMPEATRTDIMPVYNYIQNSIESGSHWFITGASGGQTKISRFEKLKQDAKQERELKEQRAKSILKSAKKEPSKFELTIKEAETLEKDYNYKDALRILNSLKDTVKTLEEKKTVYSKLASNLIKINDNNGAITNFKLLCDMCLETGDFPSYGKYKIEMGKIYKKLYSFSKAKNCFFEILEKNNSVSNEVKADAKISLGEIYELENNFEGAIKEYKDSYKILLETKGEADFKLPDITYKMAALHDENGCFEEALNEYNDSIRYAEISKNESHLIKSYANSGVIYADMGDTNSALSYLKYAFELSKNAESYIDSYYIARNIADIYKNTEPEKSYDYLNDSLNYAKLSGNSFEISMSLLELGDFYYNLKQNEQALICYYQAKETLGDSASKEDLERVATRINDMRIKLGEYIFKGMEELYDSKD